MKEDKLEIDDIKKDIRKLKVDLAMLSNTIKRLNRMRDSSAALLQ